MVESLGNINNVKLKIWFYLSVTYNFISLFSSYKCELESYEYENFKLVEMDLGVKQEIGPSVEECFVYLGVYTNRIKLHVIVLVVGVKEM